MLAGVVGGQCFQGDSPGGCDASGRRGVHGAALPKPAAEASP